MKPRMLWHINPHARSLITAESYLSAPQSLFSKYMSSLDRKIDIEPLIVLLNEAKDKYSSSKSDRISSDGWLAPRVHASLRLYRREAGDLRIWEYLSLVVPEVREYVVWRWGDGDGRIRDLKRIYGSDRRHALGRLWWVAELTRNGPDYTPATPSSSSIAKTVREMCPSCPS